MNAAEKIAHAAERKAFEAMLDSLIRKSQTKDVCTVANDFVNMVQKIHSSVWTPETFEMLHQIANAPDSKWAHYAERLLRECDPYLLRTFLTAAAYEGGFRGFQQARANSEKYDCNIPWIVLMDPTSACNMRCAGCWAAEYGYKQNLTFEEMDRVLTEGAELGTHACLFTGGEPLMRKADIFRLCEKHRDIAFHAFTNGTLIDQAFCDELKRVGNFIVSVSIEGFEDANDGRRGTGHFEKALAAMDLMHKNHIPFGVSICYTSKNYKVVTSDEFLDLLISKGSFFAWYFHYMPVGMGATTDLLLNPEQRAYMKDRVREIRGLTGGKEIFAIDFQNDTITIRHTVVSCYIDGKQVQKAQDITKTKSSMRTLPLIPAFKELLLHKQKQQNEFQRMCGKSYNKDYLGYICVDEMGRLLSPHYLTEAFAKLLKKHGLRKIRYHDLRHSCASLLLANGVPMKQIQEWLGHSDFSTTANVYAHLECNSKRLSAAAMTNGLQDALNAIS